MTRGFYNLVSGMLSQGRRLDVIANNMTNISTAGYKAEQYTDRTFDDLHCQFRLPIPQVHGGQKLHSREIAVKPLEALVG